MRLDRRDHFRERIDITHLDDRAEAFTRRMVGVLHRMNERQGHLAFGQVIAKIFTECRGIGGVIQHVIGNLECVTKIQAVIMQAVLRGLVGAGKQCRLPRGGSE